MTDHAALLRQIRTDARPYIEQALDLADVFTGFRKLASENGLDWGVIKALIKAEVQDEREGGSEKVERIIEKADFASAYADMLGLGTKMNENNFSSSQDGVEAGKASNCDALVSEGAHGSSSHALSSLPPHDPDGVLIEEPAAEPEAPQTAGGGGAAPNGALSKPSPTLSNEAAPASGDVSGDHGLGRPLLECASPTIPPASASPSEANAATVSPPAVAAPFELEDIPPGLDRREKRVAA